MLPVIALVGRPNVGKSTLFNVLTGTRDAIVADVPGLTRDRQYGYGRVGPVPCVVIDTGGLIENPTGIEAPMRAPDSRRRIISWRASCAARASPSRWPSTRRKGSTPTSFPQTSMPWGWV